MLAKTIDRPYFNIRKPPREFILKTLLAVAVTVLLLTYLMDRYKIGIDHQVEISNAARFFVYDTTKYSEKHFERGNYLVFQAKNMDPWHPDGRHVLKRIMGVPGDRFVVNEDGVFINDEHYGTLFLAEKMEKPPSSFFKEEVIPENSYVVIGTSIQSFDSRYWGYVTPEQFLAKAYPIL